MIASSAYELALKCLGCEYLHTEFHKDPLWDPLYLMCTSTICLAFQITAPYVINTVAFNKLYCCSSVWSSSTNTNINKLQNVQNFAARIDLITSL